MKRNLRDFFIGVCGSLFASFLLTITAYFVEVDSGGTFFEYLIKTIVEFKFIVYWLLFLLGIMLLRRVIRSRIDKLQAPYPMVFSIAAFHDMKFKYQFYGFKWDVYASIKQSDPRTGEINEIVVDSVKGAYCINDYREMKVTRTFFGRYKFKCPKCGHTRYTIKSNHTLQCELEDEAESQYRNKELNKAN
ncbi:hypothetical protein [Niallia sp. FSL K6-0077]|uniref:hypothetical protein n=1 Tax=Niallia sp. FSL K6-0077 TaxID=2954743 RepID=UPI0030F6020A